MNNKTNQIKNNYNYFNPIFCSECKGKDLELFKHAFTDVLTCIDCIGEGIIRQNAEKLTKEDKINLFTIPTVESF